MHILSQLICAPIALIIRGEVLVDHMIHPKSGVRQGCPLSPILFAMHIGVVICKIPSACSSVIVLLYVDNILIIIKGCTFRVSIFFSNFSGMCMNGLLAYLPEPQVPTHPDYAKCQ